MDRTTIKALVVMALILIGPIAMLGLVYCTNHTGPAKPAPKPTVNVRSI